jgi:peptidoglycan-associated lipoprotein
MVSDPALKTIKTRLPKELNMTIAKTFAPSRFSLLALTACLAFSTGCATKPKVVAPSAASGNPTAAATSVAAPVSRAPAQTALAAPTQLAPIARAEDFSSGAQAGLRPVPSAAPPSAATIQAAATLAEAGDRIFFLTDRFDLTEEARAILGRQAAWINANPAKRVIVAGSADERGTREYNLALGSKRASAARDYLISLGINGASIETVSYGKERPIDARSNPDGWAINRNSQTQLLD